MQNLLFDEMIQDRSHDTVRNRFESNFVKNFNQFGFVVMATHGTPTVVRVPRSDTLTMENVPTWEGT